MEVEKLQGEGLDSLFDDTGKPGNLNSHGEYVPEEFRTWEHEGKTYHPVGLLQFWWRGYTDEKTWTDPPRPSAAFTAWLEQHDVGGQEFFVGPPHLIFPTAQVAELFRVHWHVPGEVQHGEYIKWCHRPKAEDERATHADMEAAMERAKLAAAEYRAQHGL